MGHSLVPARFAMCPVCPPVADEVARRNNLYATASQITPRVLIDVLAAGGDEAMRAFDAMMGTKKIDIAAIGAGRRG